MDKISRREALRRVYQAVIASGASSFFSYADLAEAAASEDRRLDVVWLHGTSCTGCSCAFLDIEEVPLIDVITRFSNIVFHPDVSLATGDQVVDIIEKVASGNRPYLFVLEGGIPVGMPHACLVAHKPITHWVEKLAAKAVANVAAGTCSALGGIPKMAGTVTGSMTLDEFLKERSIDKPVVNLPNCPMKPEHLVFTLLYIHKTGRFPEMDAEHRPLKFFGHTIHERCIYYSDFQERRYAEHIGDDGCLLKLGCQGPVTRSDCVEYGHNGNTNNCIKAGHPCVGCADVHFPRPIMFHAFGDRRAAEHRLEGLEPQRNRTRRRKGWS